MDATFNAFCEIQLAKIRQANLTYHQKAYVAPPKATAPHVGPRRQAVYGHPRYEQRGPYQRRLFDVVEAYS